MHQLIQLLENILSDNLPANMEDGGVIRDGFDEKLDMYRNYEKNASKLLLELEEKERQNSGIDNLKIGFNNVFGYYFHVSKSHTGKVPSHFIRKQTLTNAERYYTQGLKEIEDNILSSKDNALKREKELLENIFMEIEKYITQLQEINRNIANLDLLCSLSQIAYQNKWVKPEFVDSDSIIIKKGRHPLVERSVPKGEFIANDLDLKDGIKFALLTGPNMGGKSTFLRQGAILIYLAHIGSFVPVESMSLPVLDGIYSRIGASDALQEGKSTFMVEMFELSEICKDATNKSFVIVDEIGRGTSTEDGLAIARSVLDYFVENIGSFTLFATHFFDLIDVVSTKKNAKNLHVEVYEENDDVAFLHSVKEGGMARSFGLHVAKKAGLPNSIIDKAEEYLKASKEKPTKSVSKNFKEDGPSLFD